MIEQLVQADRLMAVDLVDQAEVIYLRVVEADPNNAIAVVGLARCALERDEQRRAWELAAEALAIDPENDMARRMEARLAEVLATRGEPVTRPAVAYSPAAESLRPVVTEPATVGAAPPAAGSPAVPAEVGSTATDDARSGEPTAATGATRPAPAEAPLDTEARQRSLLDRLLGR